MSFQVRKCLLRAALIACSGAAMAAPSAAAPAAGESQLQQQDGAAIRSLLVAAMQATAGRGNAYRLRELAERFCSRLSGLLIRNDILMDSTIS